MNLNIAFSFPCVCGHLDPVSAWLSVSLQALYISLIIIIIIIIIITL